MSQSHSFSTACFSLDVRGISMSLARASAMSAWLANGVSRLMSLSPAIRIPGGVVEILLPDLCTDWQELRPTVLGLPAEQALGLGSAD